MEKETMNGAGAMTASKAGEKKASAWKKAWKVFAAAAGAVLVLIVAANLVLTVKSLTHPDVPADLFGFMPVVMTTDSMAPGIRMGDLMLIEKCGSQEIGTGDVILYRDPREEDKGSLVTHRVTKVSEGYFLTASDADGEEDPLPVPAENVLGKFRRTLPLLGGLVRFLKTTAGLVTAVLLTLAGIATYELLMRRKEKKTAENLRDAEKEADREKRTIDKPAVRSV